MPFRLSNCGPAFRAIVAQKAMLIPPITLLVGVYFHFRGHDLNNADALKLRDALDAIFLLMTVVSGVFAALHGQNAAGVADNAQKIEVTKDVVNENAKQLDQVTPPSMVAAKVVEANPPEKKP